MYLIMRYNVGQITIKLTCVLPVMTWAAAVDVMIFFSAMQHVSCRNYVEFPMNHSQVDTIELIKLDTYGQ